MNGYKTSRDYRRLKELLDEGREVVCFTELTPTERKYAHIARKQVVQGVQAYNMAGFWINRTLDSFVRSCTIYDVEFIEPDKNKSPSVV